MGHAAEGSGSGGKLRRSKVGKSLRNVCERTVIYFYDEIAPLLLQKQSVVVVAHPDTIKAIIQHVEKKDEKATEELEIVPGTALVYELGPDLSVRKSPILIRGKEAKSEEKPAVGPLPEKNLFWSKEMREMQIYSAEQIIVPEDAPGILKNYCKEVIRSNPADIIKFSREYSPFCYIESYRYFEKLLNSRGAGKK